MCCCSAFNKTKKSVRYFHKDDLHRTLTNIEPNITALAKTHQAQAVHEAMNNNFFFLYSYMKLLFSVKPFCKMNKTFNTFIK